MQAKYDIFFAFLPEKDEKDTSNGGIPDLKCLESALSMWQKNR